MRYVISTSRDLNAWSLSQRKMFCLPLIKRALATNFRTRLGKDFNENLNHLRLDNKKSFGSCMKVQGMQRRLQLSGERSNCAVGTGQRVPVRQIVEARG
jgi:hypothetical protein